MAYDKAIDADLGDLMEVHVFKNCCKAGAFIDYDGFGHPVKDAMADESVLVKPSMLCRIPADATHVIWFNR